MSLKNIRLELARDPEHPSGSDRHGYEFIAPLDDEGHIDVEEYRNRREECRVWRFWNGEDDEFGRLVHTRGGSWAFHYDVEGVQDVDESGFRFGEHSFVVGEYVSIREPDGDLITFQVRAVRSAQLHPLPR
ncbi:hypothetical protein SAMN06265365_12123 [Tistlia consotensis]|uniref:Uncharacterized protein n=1 Tax=Tistlia consotensis USBA 355 TaxID=560819 RepID=A0A1Y6CLM9_9PROT|nr:hypothetical protein [Tistlia consotensis]SMF60850.1 hypothetical protein SAMN05428998_123100 [Tistlia consotensis USBA 355]SNR92616.1 hypothetical protein SAMN06265365_12123 [Tistlia consotensis]